MEPNNPKHPNSINNRVESKIFKVVCGGLIDLICHGDLQMLDRIIPLLELCSMFLVFSFINGVRYIYFIRKLKLINEEFEEEMYKAIKNNKIKFTAFFVEPIETGVDKLDLLLFKIHRSAMWCILLLIFYPVSVIFMSLLLRL